MTDMDQAPGNLPATYRHQSLSLHRMLMPDRGADIMRAQCMSGGEWEYGKWLMVNPPSPEVRSRLEQRHRDIAANLAHHDQHAIAAAVADVIACYRNFIKNDENPQKVITKYVKELHGIPTWACVRACDAIRNNQAPGISLQFPFNTMQLRAVAESYIHRLQDEAREISQIMLGGRLPEPANPEVRAKVAKGLARLAFKMKGDRRREDDAMRKPMMEKQIAWNTDFVLRDYRRRGQHPVFAGGVLLSPELLDSINQRNGVSNAASVRGASEATSDVESGASQSEAERR